MRAVSFLKVGIAAAVSCGAAACGNGDDTSSPPPPPLPAVDAGIDASKGLDATSAEDGEGSDRPPTRPAGWTGRGRRPLSRCCAWPTGRPMRLRFDFCLARHGTGAFEGPILAANAASIDDAGVVDAGSGSLAFPQVTAYLLLDPAQYDARVVAAGSVNCSTGIADATNLPALASGGLETLALSAPRTPSMVSRGCSSSGSSTS